MANYMKCVDGVNIEMSDSEHTARVAEEAKWESEKPARAFEGLRQERNTKLVETDYLALNEQTLSDDMKDYRDNLRKLPNGLNNESVLEPINWPVKP